MRNPDRMKMAVRPGTVVVFADVVCGWATVASHRFPIPKRFLDSEIPVVGMLARPISLLHEIVDVAANERMEHTVSAGRFESACRLKQGYSSVPTPELHWPEPAGEK